MRAVAYTVVSTVAQPISALVALLVRRELGPFASGILGSLTLVLFYATYSHLGVLVAAERDLPMSRGGGDTARGDAVRRVAFTVTVGASLAVAGAIIGWTAAARHGADRRLVTGALVFAAIVVVQQWTAYFVVVLRSERRFDTLARVQAIVAFGGGLANVVGAGAAGFAGLVTAMLAVNIVQAVVVTRAVGAIPRVSLERHERRRLFRLGVPLLAYGGSVTALRTVDNVLVLRLIGVRGLGLYSIALVAGNAVFALATAASVTLFATVQETYGRTRSVEALKEFVTAPTIVLGILIAPVVSVLWLVVPALVHQLMPAFDAGTPAFRVIVLATYFTAAFQPSATALIAVNRQGVLALCGGGGVVMAVTAAVAAGTESLSGIALATSAGYAFTCVTVLSVAAGVWIERRRRASFVAGAFVPLAASAAAVASLDRLLADVAPLGRAAVATAVYLALYCSSVAVFERRFGSISSTIHLLRAEATT